MFNNLIESSSHRSELKRRGSFFLFTTVTYALLFILAGVGSIYAYDASLGEQDLEVVAILPPADLAPQNVVVDHPASIPRHGNATNELDERRNPTATVDLPNLAPDKVSTSPATELPVRGPYKVGPADSNAKIGDGNSELTGEGYRAVSPPVIEVITPPPDPAPKPAPKIIKAQEILNGRAVSLPKPNYPQMAKLMHLQAKVSVQVLIDETGKVVSARAIDGHPLFRQVSESAAFQARFSPTKLGDQAVKVSGVITYNFILQ
jgi:outer membrane biosynthesis protein TonB